LATVAQPLVEMGRLSVENLNQLVSGTAKVPIRVVLQPKFIERESIKELKK